MPYHSRPCKEFPATAAQSGNSPAVSSIGRSNPLNVAPNGCVPTCDYKVKLTLGFWRPDTMEEILSKILAFGVVSGCAAAGKIVVADPSKPADG